MKATNITFIKNHISEFAIWLWDSNNVKKFPHGVQFWMWWSLFCIEKNYISR